MKQIVLALALALLAPNLFAIQGTLVTAKEDLRGDIRWDAEKQLYTVAFKKGKTLVNLQRPADDVVRLEIPEPPEFKRALALIEKGSAAAAVPVLNKIANDYLRLKWDMIALRHLVLAHLAADKPDRAYDTCKTVLVRDKSAAYTGAFAPAFWQVLLKGAECYDKLGRSDLAENFRTLAKGTVPALAQGTVPREKQSILGS